MRLYEFESKVKPEVYIDMDGVLVDFFNAWAKLMGEKSFRDIKDIDKGLQAIRDEDDFWLKLKPTPNAGKLLALVRELKGSYTILSSPLADDPRSEPHKRMWVEKNLKQFPPKKVIITGDKAKYAQQSDGTPNILIDDFGQNIAKWEAAGGIGVKHKDHKFERTFKSLMNHLKQDYKTTKEGWNENFAESTLNEYRNALYDFVKSKFPTWPEYVLKDFLYSQAKHIRDEEELKDFLERNQKDFGQVKWRLEKLPITLDIFTPKTQRMIKQRAGGSSNPMQVPKDAERHAQQLKMIQQQGVRTEPIIVAKLNNGYDLIEGWHRTIQHLQQYPEGYTGPAWVAYGATYTSESMNENFADGKKKGKSRPGRVKKAGASCKGSVTDLRKKAKNASGEKAKMYHWCANMKSGRNK